MKEIIKVDLRIARQQSGLKGQDVALLLGSSKSRLSKLENGYARPRVREIISLSLIYGKPLDSLFQLSSSALTEKLRERLSNLDFTGIDNRQRLDSLNALASRLQALRSEAYGA